MVIVVKENIDNVFLSVGLVKDCQIAFKIIELPENNLITVIGWNIRSYVLYCYDC